MTPLDLTKGPPRSPREKLRGLCMFPRMIDIARAKLSGGEIGEYQIGRAKTLSAVLLSAFGVSAAQFVELVRDATTDEDVAESLWPGDAAALEALSARLPRITVADVPLEVQPDFQRLYGRDLPSDRCVFDVLDADDAQAFSDERPNEAIQRTAPRPDA